MSAPVIKWTKESPLKYITTLGAYQATITIYTVDKSIQWIPLFSHGGITEWRNMRMSECKRRAERVLIALADVGDRP